MRIILAAVVWALWLPALLWLLAGRHWTSAAAFFFAPVVLVAPWSGWARAILVPLGIYTLLPSLFRGAIRALMNRPIKWKGRVI